MAYATRTTVSVEKTQTEIKTLLLKFGADDIAVRQNLREKYGQVAFSCRERVIRFTLPIPDHTDPRFHRGRQSGGLITEAWEQESRSLWRGLLLCIKAKIESVESNIEQFDEAFLAHTVDISTGKTIIEMVRPTIHKIYASGGDHYPLLTHHE